MPNTICAAIASRNLIEINYIGNKAPGMRIVEPHMVAYNEANNLALSAWYLSGESESRRGPGWREYLLTDIANVTILPQTFAGPRPGYKPGGGKTFHNVQCEL
jgi:hypothetical protein